MTPPIMREGFVTDTGVLLRPPALPILFWPCAWHTPTAVLAALALAYPGQVSHTMCASCAEEFERQCA